MIVLAPRPDDLHPDHAHLGVLVREAAFLSGVSEVRMAAARRTGRAAVLQYASHTQFAPSLVVDVSRALRREEACRARVQEPVLRSGVEASRRRTSRARGSGTGGKPGRATTATSSARRTASRSSSTGPLLVKDPVAQFLDFGYYPGLTADAPSHQRSCAPAPDRSVVLSDRRRIRHRRRRARFGARGARPPGARRLATRAPSASGRTAGSSSTRSTSPTTRCSSIRRTRWRSRAGSPTSRPLRARHHPRALRDPAQHLGVPRARDRRRRPAARRHDAARHGHHADRIRSCLPSRSRSSRSSSPTSSRRRPRS